MSNFKTKLIVAAIDFGTTYSGYAYTFRDEYMKNPSKETIIYTNDWTDGSGLITHKTPSVILFEPDGTFNSFGYEAEDTYAGLAAENKHRGWRYFKRFKMELHFQKRLSRNMKLTYDNRGNKMLALDVFAAAIKYFKDHLMERMKTRLNDIRDTDIDWVITVPAIWQDDAKQFMQEAAAQAGIPIDQLELALEPEAAAIYCKELDVAKAKEQGHESRLTTFNEGAQFMVLDLGGGTIDITAHEVLGDGSLKGICSPCGGPWGGTIVDKHIDETFCKMFGKKVIDQCKERCKSEDLDLQRSIELKKRTIKSTSSGAAKINLAVPGVFFETYNSVTGKKFEDCLEQGSFAKSVKRVRDKMQIDPAVFVDCFKESMLQLIENVEKLLSRPGLKKVNIIMMVGGFSISEIMQNAVRNKFGGSKAVIIPEEADVAVLKGAVVYGFNKNAISSRVLSYTYGVSTAVPYNERIHPDSKKVYRDGIYKCEDVFKVFIKAGTTVVPNKTTAQHTFAAPFPGLSHVTVDIYRSTSTDPMYVTDDDCERRGEILVEFKKKEYKDKKPLIDVTMIFGDTVLDVEASEQGTNKKFVAKLNFL